MDDKGEEFFILPVTAPIPSELEQNWDPGPLSTNTFSEEELSQIDGHWIYNFSLLILLILAMVIFKENRNLRSLSILLPLIALVLILELFKLSLDSKLLDSMNIIVIFESLVVGMAIILLLGQRVSSSKVYISIIIALVTFAIVGVAGVIGFSDGRYVAVTDLTLKFYGVQAGVWLLAMALTVFFCRKNFSYLRLNLFALLSFFISHLIGMYIITLQMAATNAAKANIAGNMQWILIGAVALTFVYYIITMPYLILAYRSTEYDKRLLNWLGQS